jgi:hypothetical protein
MKKTKRNDFKALVCCFSLVTGNLHCRPDELESPEIWNLKSGIRNHLCVLTEIFTD